MFEMSKHSITRGKRADMILIDGDPTQDISAIRNVALVLQDGDAYYPAELYGELGVKPFAPAKPETEKPPSKLPVSKPATSSK